MREIIFANVDNAKTVFSRIFFFYLDIKTEEQTDSEYFSAYK